jgi:hypothetical protein
VLDLHAAASPIRYFFTAFIGWPQQISTCGISGGQGQPFS